MATRSSAPAAIPAGSTTTVLPTDFRFTLTHSSSRRIGEWAVVQQGLNDQSGIARRYHWHSANVRDFVADPAAL
jgi:hypothetical protein